MNFNTYNGLCLTTSILMFILVSLQYSKINICWLLILASLFSIIWRSRKLVIGEEKFKEKGYDDIYFILDLVFAFLAVGCVFFSNQVNKKLLYICILAMILSWLFIFLEDERTSNYMHATGHCYVILGIILTFYINIK